MKRMIRHYLAAVFAVAALLSAGLAAGAVAVHDHRPRLREPPDPDAFPADDLDAGEVDLLAGREIPDGRLGGHRSDAAAYRKESKPAKSNVRK